MKRIKLIALAVVVSALTGCAVQPAYKVHNNPLPIQQQSDYDLCFSLGQAFGSQNRERALLIIAEGQTRTEGNAHGHAVTEAQCDARVRAGMEDIANARAAQDVANAQNAQRDINFQNAMAGMGAGLQAAQQQQAQQQAQDQADFDRMNAWAAQQQQQMQQQQMNNSLQGIDRSLRQMNGGF